MVDVVTTYVEGCYQVIVNDEDNAQVTFDDYGANSLLHSRRQRIDLVGAEPRIKRVHLEDLPLRANQLFLARGEGIELSPKILGGSELHTPGGCSSPKARSMSTTRPA